MATAVLVWAYDLGVVGEAGQDRALQGPTVWDSQNGSVTALRTKP